MSQQPGSFSLGALRLLWPSYDSGGACSCGAPLASCEVHGPLLREMFSPSAGALTPETMHRRGTGFLAEVAQISDWGDVEARARLRADHAGFLRPLAAYLQALVETGGVQTFIESSGAPGMALAFDLIDEVDLRVLNLLRDPRALAVDAEAAPGGLTGRWQALRRWRRRQRRLEQWRHGLGARYMALRNEDLHARPRDSLANVLQWAGLQMPAGLFAAPDRVRLGWEGRHVPLLPDASRLAGCPDEVVLKPRDRDSGAQGAVLRLLAVATTWPEIKRHYPTHARDAMGRARE